jgi:hypothetical protein
MRCKSERQAAGIQIHYVFDLEGWLHTNGLDELGLPELEMRHVPAFLMEDGARLLRHVAGYFIDKEKPVKVGETMQTSPMTRFRFVLPQPLRGQEEHYAPYTERWQIVAIEPHCNCCGQAPSGQQADLN